MSAKTCDDARALLELEPLDLLAPEERAGLDAHCAGCPACADERQALRAAHAALRAETGPPPAEARERALSAALGTTALGTAVKEVDVGPATTKKAILEGATVDAARVEAVGRRIALGCSYCHARAPRDEVVFCAACLAPHHAECFRAHGRCSLPGCEETATVRPGAGAAPPRRRGIRLGFVIGLAVVGGVAAWSYDERQLEERIARETGLEQALAVRDGQLAALARRAPGEAGVTLEAQGLDLKAVAAELASQAGRNVIVDPVIQETVTLSLRDVPFEDALQAVADHARCRAEPVGDRVWRLTQPPMVTLQFNDGPARTVLQLLAAYSGKNLLFGRELRDRLVTHDLKDVPWDVALVSIAHAARSRAWAVGEGLIYVGDAPPPGATPFEPWARPLLTPGEWQDAGPIDIELTEATLADACARVAAAAGRAIELRGAPDPARRVTLKVRQLPWPAVLAEVARQAGCDVEPAALGAIVRPIPRLSLVRTGPVRLAPLLSILATVERDAGWSFDVTTLEGVGDRRASVDLVDVRPREALVAWAHAAGCELSGEPSRPAIAAVATQAAPGTWTSSPGGAPRVAYSAAEPRLEAVVVGPRGAWAVINGWRYEPGQVLVDPTNEEDIEGSEVLSITKDGVRLRLPEGERSFEAPPSARR